MSLKAISSSVLALSLVSSNFIASLPARADVAVYVSDNTMNPEGAILLVVSIAIGFTSTTAINKSRYDQSKAISLLDQAYAGEGQTLEVLAQATNRSIDDVATTIVELDQAGKLDIRKPRAMSRTIADALKT